MASKSNNALTSRDHTTRTPALAAHLDDLEAACLATQEDHRQAAARAREECDRMKAAAAEAAAALRDSLDRELAADVAKLETIAADPPSRDRAAQFLAALAPLTARSVAETGEALDWRPVALAVARACNVAANLGHVDAFSFGSANAIASSGEALVRSVAAGASVLQVERLLRDLENALAREAHKFVPDAERAEVIVTRATRTAVYAQLLELDARRRSAREEPAPVAAVGPKRSIVERVAGAVRGAVGG